MWSRSAKTALLALCAVSALYGEKTRYVEQDGVKMAFSQGAGDGVTVVFQAGLGDDKSIWNGLIKNSKNSFGYIAVDRLGMGESSEAKTVRSPCEIAKEQRELLRRSGAKPPYLLVGHSLGGLYQYVYATRYPSEVAAMVLLDPTHPKHWESMQKETPSLATTMKLMRATLFSSTSKMEFDAQAECLDSLDMSSPIKAPTALLFSGSFSALERGSFENMLIKLRADWQNLIDTKNVKTIRSSTHYLQKDAPESVLDAICIYLDQKIPCSGK